MRKLLKRWYVWLGLVLLLGFAASVALISFSQSRITRANFDRIKPGMTLDEVIAILGRPPDHRQPMLGNPYEEASWSSGPNFIAMYTDRDGRTIFFPTIHLAGVSETLQWYAKKGAAKIGVKWD
jgi:hypothetical protein